MSMTSPSPPARIGVTGNNWRELAVPELGAWEPSRLVSVVIPFFEAHDELAFVLAALTQQSYPMELLQVVVLDDGSKQPLELDPEDYPFVLVVGHQEDRGFGAPRARNNGARRAAGDILVFLDSDMVPEMRHIEAHARWHHVEPDAVVVGVRCHTDFTGLEPSDVAAGVASGGLDALFADRPQQRPEWLEGHFRRTDELTSSHDDLFRVIASGNLSMRAESFWRVGGFDETFTQWGLEDTELGYRLFNDGDVLIVDRAAQCWHQGIDGSAGPTGDERRSHEEQRAKVSHLMAHRGFRRSVAGRTFRVPRVVVELDCRSDDDLTAIEGVVESVLASDFHDLGVCIRLSPDRDDVELVRRSLGWDCRVEVVTDATDPWPASSVRVLMSTRVRVAASALGSLLPRLEQPDPARGLLHMTLPGVSPRDELVTLAATRARNRARRLVGDADWKPAAGAMFGEEWLVGADHGIGTVSSPPRAASSAAVSGSRGSEYPRELVRLLEATPKGKRVFAVKVGRRIVLAGVATKRLGRARSFPALRSAVRDLGASILPWRVQARLKARRGGP